MHRTFPKNRPHPGPHLLSIWGKRARHELVVEFTLSSKGSNLDYLPFWLSLHDDLFPSSPPSSFPVAPATPPHLRSRTAGRHTARLLH